MVEKHDRIWVLYPEYFDSGISRHHGRKVSKELSIPSPTLDELNECARKIDLSPVKEVDIAYPGFWWKKRGRLLVRKEWSKSETLARMAKQLIELRNRRGVPDKAIETQKKTRAVKKVQAKDRKKRWKDRKKSRKGLSTK